MSPPGSHRPEAGGLRQATDSPPGLSVSGLSPKGEYRSAQHEGTPLTLGVRTQALLALVEDERSRRCAAILGEAQAAAAAQRSRSQAEARQAMREAFAEERARGKAALATAHAELRTGQRLHEQHHLEALLALAWQLLPDALAKRWQDAGSRAAWVQLTLSAAQQAFAAGPWQLRHASGLAPDEVPAGLSGMCDPSLSAGLSLAAAGNVLDATLQGLLADRAEVGGRLVSLLQEDSVS